MQVGLRARIVLIAAGVMLVAMGAIIAASGYVFNKEYTVALQSRSLAIAKSLSVQLERVLQFGIKLDELTGFEEQCQEIVRTNEGISFASVVQDDGDVLFHSDPLEKGRRLTDPSLLAALKDGADAEAVIAHRINGAKGYGAIVPVTGPEGSRVARVMVGFPADSITAKASEMVIVDIGVGLLALAIGFAVLVATLSIFVTNPLAKVIGAIEQIRENAADTARRLPVSSNDELGRLAQTFNSLMTDLQNTTVSKKELEDAMRVLREAEERYRQLVESSPNGIVVACDNLLMFANPYAVRLLGATAPEQLVGRPLLEFVHPDSQGLVREIIGMLLHGQSSIAMHEIRLARLDGSPLDAELTIIALSFEGRPAAQCVVRDITEIKQHRAQLEQMARHDALTGLANRNLLLDRLEHALNYAKRYACQATVVFMDLDNFKVINDSLGHNQGDALLKIIADRLPQCVRDVDTVARLGGDEFVIVLFDQPREGQGIAPVLERIQKSIAQPIVLGSHEYSVTGSIGFATYPHDGEEPETLLRNADTAMYRAKEQGRNNFQAYSDEMHARVSERLALQSSLRRALERGEFSVFYQPQVDLRKGTIIATEALIRWRHPERGLVSPDSFIPLAEETGLIVPIGEWVLRTACAQNKAWQAMGLPPIRVAVNLSARQFRQPDLIKVIQGALHDAGLEARYLELELTESLIMQNPDEAVKIMTALQAMGSTLAIDDFGTGYSSLSALKRFPLSRLKIAQMFIHDIPADADSVAIAHAVISLGGSMKLRVIAEGVETAEQYQFLQASGCDEIQGYWASKPVPAEQIPQLLARNFGHASVSAS